MVRISRIWLGLVRFGWGQSGLVGLGWSWSVFVGFGGVSGLVGFGQVWSVRLSGYVRFGQSVRLSGLVGPHVGGGDLLEYIKLTNTGTRKPKVNQNKIKSYVIHTRCISTGLHT